MKKINLMILVLLVQLVFAGSVQARCNLELFRFGSSVDSIKNQLNLQESPMLPIMGGESQQVLFVPGEEVCKDEKAFIGTPVTFVFLYDELVEIQTMRLSEQPMLISWAESIYGEKKDKPKKFHQSNPVANWTWGNFNAMITYSIRPDDQGVIESVMIGSRKHQQSFEKFFKEEEELMQRGMQ